MVSRWIYGLAVVLIAIIAIGAYLVYAAQASNKYTGSSYAVQMTDPPIVPNGTQSLVISYSKISLHEMGTNSYVNTSSSGSINLIGLSNKTQTIAIAQNASDKNFDSALFTITSANIKINGSSYTVAVPNGKIAANITGNTNSSTGGVLIDFSPVIVQVFNSTTNTKYALIGTAKAIPVSRQTVNTTGAGKIGVNSTLTSQESTALSSAGANITASNAAAGILDNASSFTVHISNNANVPVTLESVALSGYFRESNSSINGTNAIIPVNTANTINGITSNSVTANTGTANSVSNALPIVPQVATNTLNGISTTTIGTINTVNTPSNIANAINTILPTSIISNTATPNTVNTVNAVTSNTLANTALNQTVANDFRLTTNSPIAKQYILEATRYQSNFHNLLAFIVKSDGTLHLLNSTSAANNSTGFILLPHQNVTLSFNGVINLGYHNSKALIIPNQSYSVQIIGSDGASATSKINATNGVVANLSMPSNIVVGITGIGLPTSSNTANTISNTVNVPIINSIGINSIIGTSSNTINTATSNAANTATSNTANTTNSSTSTISTNGII